MRGKMVICGMLAASVALGLGACAQQNQEAAQDVAESAQSATEAATSEFKTMGDVYAASPENMSSTYGQGHFGCGFKVKDQWYYAGADLTEEQEKELDEIWTADQGKTEKLLSGLTVTSCKELTAPADDELAAYAGKKGSDLTKEGFDLAAPTVNDDQTDCLGTKGDFEYQVTFKGKVADEGTEDVAGAVADLTVEKVELSGVAWSTLEGK